MGQSYDPEHKRLEDRLDRNERRLDNHSNKLDELDRASTLSKESRNNLYKKLEFIDRRFESMDNLSKQISALATTVAVMTEQLQTNNEKTNAAINKVEEIQKQDAENHRYYKRGITTAIIGAVISFIAALIFGTQ